MAQPPRPRRHIAIGGPMGSGKTTLAGLFAEHYPALRRISFATPLKDVVQRVFAPATKDRDLLIRVGTKLREIDANVWINCALRTIAQEGSSDDRWILDDLRFQNEYDALRRRGDWFIIRLDVAPHVREQRVRETYGSNANQHLHHAADASETELSRLSASCFDAVITIDGETPAAQMAQVRVQMRKILAALHTTDNNEEEERAF